jgi:hypothetical protein
MSTPRYLPNFPDELVVKANYDKAVEGLGKISVAFQQLEDSLKIGVGKLVDPNDVQLSTILTAQLSFQAILDLFGALYQHRFNNGAEQKELRKFLGQCEVGWAEPQSNYSLPLATGHHWRKRSRANKVYSAKSTER